MKPTRTPPRTSPFSIREEVPFLASLNSAILTALQVQDLTQDVHKLNWHERILVCVDTFLKEAEAEGVSHFFYYDSAVLYDQVLLGLQEIGARDTRARLERYVEHVFGGQLPHDVTARQDALEAADAEAEDDAARSVVGLADAAARLAAWARAHEEHFRLAAA